MAALLRETVARRLGHFARHGTSAVAAADPFLLQKRPILQQAAVPPDRIPSLAERMFGLGNAGESRVRLDCLMPPEGRGILAERGGAVGVEEARKVIRAAELEEARRRLRREARGCVSYKEYVGLCGEVAGDENAPRIAKELDDAGSVVVIGDAVLLRPELVFRAIERVIPSSSEDDPRIAELKALEEKKAAIDRTAVSMVRQELGLGLAFLVLQTLGFMRLTFWELSWDVMEPICFYVTSMYFMAGYAFFLRTNREPSFEGFFQSRFESKQKHLMKLRNFDLSRFDELQRALGRRSAVVDSSFEQCTGPNSTVECSAANCCCH